MSQPEQDRSETVVVLTPTGRDSHLVCRMLEKAGVAFESCSNLAALLAGLERGLGAAIVAEECLRPAEIEPLRQWLGDQPPWSDFPFVMLTTGGESTARSLASFQHLQALGNVTLLERPVRTVTLLSAVKAALRSRRRQYEAKAYIAERLRAEEALTSQARELARSNADLQQFAYVTSHDLQEPLRAIQAYSQLLRKRYQDRLDADAEEFFGYIITGVQRMHVLIRDLLAYSRVVNLEPRTFAAVDMSEVVHWAMQNLQLAIEEVNAEITWDELPQVSGDHTELVQLVQNLLSNALKYRSSQLPRIHISAKREGAYWAFGVRDNGIGIASKYHERIFGVFKRLHGRDVPGTGIGLAICRKIVEKHHGRIWVESKEGAGATFWFRLPGLSCSG